MQVFVVRHAETQSNVERRLQGSGSAGAVLTPLGVQQAARLAVYLEALQLSFAQIYTSDAVRASHTASILGEVLGVPVTKHRELREIDCGAWEDKLHDELARSYPDAWNGWLSDPTAFCFPEGESLLDVQQRVAAFFDNVVKGSLGENLILVSHSATISALLACVHGWDLLEAWLEGRAIHKNTAFTRLYLNDKGELLRSKIASLEHLKVSPNTHLQSS